MKMRGLQSGNRRIFKTRWFERFARKEKIRDAVLVDAVARAEKGLVDVDLGGGVIKQRIARPGQGKSGGYRTIIFFRHRANIDADKEKQFKEAARHVLRLTEKQIEELVKNGDFAEVRYEQKISQ